MDDEPAAVALDDEDDVFAEPTVVPRGSWPTAARPHLTSVSGRGDHEEKETCDDE